MKKVKHIKFLKFLFHIVSPLFFGIIIYVFWRGIILFDIEPILKSSPPDWIKYNLQDGLWLYALLSAIIIIWEKKISSYLIVWIFFVLLLTFLSEIMQAYNFIQGTFDFYDMIAYFLAAIISILKIKNKINFSITLSKIKKNEFN